MLKVSDQQVRQVAIKMIGETLGYSFRKQCFRENRLDLFKLIEARIYDKSIQCRKQAFIEIAANSDYVLKILSLEDAVNLY